MMRFILPLLFFCSACGDDIIVDPGDWDPVLPTPIPTMAPPEATPEPVFETRSVPDGPDRFLWKPKSDPESATPGKLVILFPAEFSQEFDRVQVLRRSGAAENLRYTGKSNGDRQTWRGSRPGKDYVNNPSVVASLGESRFTWDVRGQSKNRID